MKTVPTEDCDVLMTFPGMHTCLPWALMQLLLLRPKCEVGTCGSLCSLADTTDDHTLLWLLNHIRVGIPELIVQVRHHRHTRAYAFFVTATYERRVPCFHLPLALPPGFPALLRANCAHYSFVLRYGSRIVLSLVM